MSIKKEKLLNEMITTYIKYGVPVGSELLKLSVDMKISSATIRNYFKILVDEGVLAQPHVSSGKIPTNATLKTYWRENIDISDAININSIDDINRASIEHRIFCNIKIPNINRLEKIINHNNEYTILVFHNMEVIVPYTRQLHVFLHEFLYQDIEDIKTIARGICANELYNRLENITDAKIYNFGFEELFFIKDLDFILRLINGAFYYTLKNGFYFDLFPDGYMGILQDIMINNNYGKMFVVGDLKQDYTSFYQKIAS